MLPAERHPTDRFPAQQLGPGWITAHLAPFPDVRFIATGGISSDNAADFLSAGCAAVAVGSALADPMSLPRLRMALGRTPMASQQGRDWHGG